MIKGVLKRLNVFLLTALLVIGILPGTALTALAAGNVNEHGVEFLSAASEGGTWTADLKTINGSVQGTAEGCGGFTPASSATSTLTLTNEADRPATLSFKFSVTANGGNAVVDGTNYTSDVSDELTKLLGPNESISVALTSAIGAQTTKISITELSLTVADENVNVTFEKPENGSYKVDDAGITEEKTESRASATKVKLAVDTPDEGYRFFGWYMNGSLISRDDTYQTYVSEGAHIKPLFISETAPVLGVGADFYFDWSEAVNAADPSRGAKSTVIYVAEDCSVKAGETVTIPNGVMLLVPFDAANTVYTTAPVGINGYTKPQLFRKLTVEGTIKVESGGTISVSGKHNSAQGSSGAPTGNYGQIELSGKDSLIELDSGAALYAYGFITGNGTVRANSGSTVYEYFQFNDFRGGTMSSHMLSRTEKVFFFSQYYVQNIEAKLEIHRGAKELLYTSAYAGSQVNSASANFIDENGLFSLTGEGSYLVKSYDGTNDRLLIDIYGDAQLKAISVYVASVSMDSKGYVLPINSNISINIKSGTTSVTSDTSLLPGAQITVDKDATLRVNEGVALFAYGRDEWVGKQFVYSNADLRPINYAVNRGKTRNSSDLVDVIVDVNGTVTVGGGTKGGFFTTGDGAAIKSTEGTGVITFTQPSDNTRELYEVTQSSSTPTYHSIPITSAKLLNNDNSCTETADCGENARFGYADGKWVRQEKIESLAVSPVTAQYDAQEHGITVTTVDHEPQPTVQYQKQGTDNWTSDKPVDVGVYDAKITRSEDTYYETFEQIVENAVTITPAPLTLKWDENTEFTYNGGEHSVSAALEGTKGSDELTVTLSDDKHTDAGTYQATAQITGDKIGNYELPENLTQEWSIAKATAPNITFPTAEESTYDPNRRLENVKLTGGSEEYGTFEWAEPDTVPEVGKSYTVTFKPSEETKRNYEEITETTAQVNANVQKGEQAEPAGVTAHSEQTIPGGDGRITGVDTSMEWKKHTDGEDAWRAVEGTEITGLAADSYDVRFKANENQNAGATVTVTVNEYDPTAEPQPEASIDYKAEQLTGLEPNGDYTINESPVKADGDGKIHIDEAWIGARISIVKKGDGVMTNDSGALEMAVPARPAAPSGLEGGYTSKPGAEDGKVTGLVAGTAYEYKTEGDTWTTLTGETKLKADTYQVRLAATNEAFYSEETEITVQDPAYAATPNVTIDYENEKLTGFGEGSYTVNDEAVTVGEDSAVAIRTEWFGKPINIVLKGSGPAVIDSLPQSVHVPARPAAPELQGKAPTSPAGTDGSVTGLDSGKLYEYRTDGGEWTPVEAGRESIDGLAAGEYEVRLKATESSFAGDSAAVTVTDYVAPPAPSNPGSGGTGAPDDSKTETVTNPDGSTTTTTTKPDGTSVETTTTPEGVVGTTGKDASGNVTNADVTVPQGGAEGVVKAPVEVPSAGSTKDAPEVNVHVQGEGSVKMEVPVTHVGPGTVAVVVNPDGTEEVVRDCVISEDGVVLNVEGDVTLKIVENSLEFKDIEGVESWAGDAIEFTSARELFSGVGNSNFQLNGYMTRGALVTLLHRLSFEPDAPAAKFSDVDENGIYADAIAWADANSIVTGNGNGLFMPDDNITREQLVTLIYNYAKFRGAVRENTGNINAFADADKVHDYAREAMAWAIGAGIVSGQGDNTLNPAGITTRAQTAVILMNLCNYMAK